MRTLRDFTVRALCGSRGCRITCELMLINACARLARVRTLWRHRDDIIAAAPRVSGDLAYVLCLCAAVFTMHCDTHIHRLTTHTQARAHTHTHCRPFLHAFEHPPDFVVAFACIILARSSRTRTHTYNGRDGLAGWRAGGRAVRWIRGPEHPSRAIYCIAYIRFGVSHQTTHTRTPGHIVGVAVRSVGA